MEQETLASKLAKEFRDTGIEVEDVCEGIKFSLGFGSFELVDYIAQKRYMFPEGHVAARYDPGTGTVSFPFVEGKYAHPLLKEPDAENQFISMGCFVFRPVSSLENGITRMLRCSVQHLQECYGKHGENPTVWHRLEEDIFEEYIIGSKAAATADESTTL